MRFEWDEAKDRANQAKHGISLSIAEAFDFDGAMWIEDTTHDEQRFVAYGHATDGRGYVIAFTFRGEDLRIISARRFTKKEHQLYGY